MPQIFQVLRCYKCLVFQVHQTKKSNKFECKMCGEKQSIKRHYGLGNGQECRKHVQKLNVIRGEIDESKSLLNNTTDDENENVSDVIPTVQKFENKPSKWSEYVENIVENTESPNSDNDKSMYLGDTEVVLELPKKRRKILGKSFNENRYTKTSADPDQSSDYKTSSLSKGDHKSSSSIQISNHIKSTTFTPPIKKETCLSSDVNISSNSSNWAAFDNEKVNDGLNLKQTEVSLTPTNNDSKKKFVPLAINKNSKWAKFAENTDNSEENELEESTISQSTFQNDPHTLFSLCDDNDLDDYLTI